MTKFRLVIIKENGERQEYDWCNAKDFTIQQIKEQVEPLEKRGCNFIIEYK